MRTVSRLLVFLLLTAVILTACEAAPQGSSNGRINVVATTTIVGDVVQNIGGNHINLEVLIPVNVDEHGYQPTPQDSVKVSRAKILFENGAGLEQFIDRLMQNAGGSAKLVSVSDGIQLQQGPSEEPQGSQDALSYDPHVWMDPNNVLVWVVNIEKALSASDPQNAADYQKNAAQYRQQLKDLDGWVRQQVQPVPEGRRDLVTDHLVFTYFAKRYGFKQVGAVVPGYSSLASPSAQQLASLEDNIRKLNVAAIFVGNTVNPALAERVAQDTHTKLVHILTGSLTDAKGTAPTYIDYIKYNVRAIVGALQ